MASMFAAGFAINLVTATIAAVSVGIGIDFAIHFIVRYREELARHGGSGDGSAGSKRRHRAGAAGVGDQLGDGFRHPRVSRRCRCFAAYGLLTAVMIVMALVATLAVLPSLLVLITSDVERQVSEVDLDAPLPKPQAA